jgi:hypothetical protein
MNKAIDLLERADAEIRLELDKSTSASLKLSEVASYINEALAVLRSPRFETPEQYKKRREERAVYSLYKDDYGVKYWFVERFKYVYTGRRAALAVICATETGPLPDSWEPEKEK